ncbi:MAG TPA: hypothetical protein VH394_00210 [Thermoanaerobaculia bacterium]|jgi:hypothetical protein|nr:hypothetical protein [Thermoanaerobaculia bacterium]
MNRKLDPSEGTQYLLQWDTTARIGTTAGEQESRVRGEAILEIFGDHETRKGVSLKRFGIAAASVRARSGKTGVITVVGTRGTGIFKPADSSLRIELDGTINYESLDAAHQKNTAATCYYIPATEPCGAVIEGKLVVRGRTAVLAEARIQVACAAGDLGEIQSIVIDLGKATLLPIPASRANYRDRKPGTNEDSNADDNICIQVNKRRLTVQPVGFRTNAADPSPSGSTAAAQLGMAQTVWGKGCIEIQINPMTILTDATLKTSSDLNLIRASFTDPDPNIIEVFFVQNSLPAQGGGQAGGIGLASCKPVIAEPNAGNPVLVSHELGHVLGLLHPGVGSNSDANTVMTPTGGANNPGVAFVTHFMCTNIANPVLQTLADLCCLSHDIGDHFIRDFPTDTGLEPSGTPPAGIHSYSNSFVWNRQTNTPGTFDPVFGPEHQNPARFNADMTAHTNFLFARVEQRNNLLVRNAVVKFFLKTPGSGGGAANLTALGQVAVPATLGVGLPVDVALPWMVPAGTPNHSCVFAVVRSDAEQEGDQSGLDWWGFENLAHVDNDWAQRNLDIEDVSSSNTGDGNIYESAPFFLLLPPIDDKALRLTLEIDATRAKGLTNLVVDVVGGKPAGAKPGAVTKLDLDLANRREPYVVVLRGTLPPKLAPGKAFTVTVNPSVGERPIVGFGATFRVAAWNEVLAQSLDVAAAAFGDISTFAELPSARRLFCSIRGGCGAPYSLRDLASWLVEQRGVFEALAGELKGLPAATATGAFDALQLLLRTIKAFTDGKSNEHDLNGAFRAAANRVMASACILAGR